MKIIISLMLFVIFFQGIKLNIPEIPFLSYIDEIFIVICLILALKRIIKSGTINKNSFKILLALMVFIILGSLSCVLNSQFDIKSLMVSMFLSVKFWLLIFALENIKLSEGLKESIIKVIFIVEKIAIVIAIFNLFFTETYLNYFSFDESYYRFGMISITSCFNHPATFGWFMLFCAMLRFSIFYYEKQQKDAIIGVIDILFSLLSLRTKVFISVIVCIIFYVLYINKKNIKKIIKKLPILLLISILILFLFKDIIINTYDLYFLGNQGETARQVLDETGKEILKDYFPIGVGFGKFGTYYAALNYSEYYYIYGISDVYGLTKDDPKYSMDTFWPAIMGETGFLGLIVYIYLVVSIFKQLFKCINLGEKRPNVDKIYNLTSILIFIQFVVESYGEATFNTSPQNILVAIFIGISLNTYNKKKEEE